MIVDMKPASPPEGLFSSTMRLKQISKHRKNLQLQKGCASVMSGNMSCANADNQPKFLSQYSVRTSSQMGTRKTNYIKAK